MPVRIGRSVDIPENEISYSFSRSGGPGGQKVNKTSTRVTLLFNVDASESLSESERALVKQRLAGRIGKDGVLRVVSQQYRTQTANRREALERFVELMKAALKRERKRKRTRVPETVKEERLRSKKHRSRIKRERARSHDPCD
jgi:ribosome-associated protein